MIKRILALALAMSLVNASVYAAENNYWSTANDNIVTGIGAEEQQTEIKLGNADDYIKNGWSAEYAEILEEETEFVSEFQKEVDLVIILGLMSDSAAGFFGESMDFRHKEYLSYEDYKVAMNILNKYGTGSVNVQKKSGYPTCEEIIKNMIAVLGYEVYYADTDSFFAAGTLGITDGLILKPKDRILREQFAKLLTNVIEIDMSEISSGASLSYEFAGDKSILDKMNIFKTEGVLNATEYVNLFSTKLANKNSVQIDSRQYKIGESNAVSYLGHYVDAYIKDDDGEEIILYIDINEKKDNYIEIFDTDIKNINKSGVEYYIRKDDSSLKKERESFSQNASVLYNGAMVGTVVSVDKSVLMPKNGKVELSDTDADGIYDVLLVWDYETVSVDKVAGERVLFKDNKGILDFSNENIEFIMTLDGQNITVSDLAEWNVLSLAKTLDQKMYTIVVSTTAVSGEYTGRDGDYIILDDIEKVLLDKSFSTDIKMGQTYTFYLTADKKAVVASFGSETFTQTGTGRNYGYIRRAVKDTDNEGKAIFRIYKLSNNTWVTLSGADKIIFKDGISDEERLTAAEVADKLTTPQLIVFETNIKGQLSSVKTAADFTDGTLDDNAFALNKKIDTGNVRTYYSGYFGGIYQRNKLIMLRIPGDRSKEENYGTETISGDSRVYAPLEIYDVNEGLAIDGVILRYEQSDGAVEVNGYGDKKFVIENINKAYIEGEVVYKVTAVGGAEYYIEDNDEKIGFASKITDSESKALWTVEYAKDLKKGDLLCANVDSFGYISSFRVDVRIPEIDKVKYFSYETTSDLPSLSYDYGIVANNPNATNVVLDINGNKVPRLVNGVTVSYDKETGEFETITKNDILPGDIMLQAAQFYNSGVIAVVIK